MIYIRLILVFFKIGLFSFGGGYAMIPLLMKEIVANTHWLTSQEFTDIIAISVMTPGPIAVNSATFVGYKITDVWGGVLATFGVALPSFIIVLIVSHFFFQFQNNKWVKRAFYGLRPAVTGLIAAAAVSIAQTSILKGFSENETFLYALIKSFQAPLQHVSIANLFIFAASLIILLRFKKFNPILLLALAGAVGAFIF